MSIVYQTGTSSGLQDMLSKVSTFATTTVGLWTQDVFDTSSSTSRWLHLHLTAGGCSVGLEFTYPFTGTGAAGVLNVIGDEGYTGSGNYLLMTNPARAVPVDFPATAFTSYYLFGGPDYIHCVVQSAAGIYKHFNFGILNKYGTWTGGSYFTGSYWPFGGGTYGYYSDQVYVGGPWDSMSSNRSGSTWELNYQDGTHHWSTWEGYQNNGAQNIYSSAPGEVYGWGGARGGWHHEQVRTGPNTFNGVAPMEPIVLFVQQTGGLYAPAGAVKGAQYINMKNYNPGDTFTIGSATWQVFPLATKGPVLGTGTDGVTPNSSGNYGIAYQKS